MHKPYAIGIDVGGTKIAGGLVDETGTVLQFEITPNQQGDQEIGAPVLSLVEVSPFDGSTAPVLSPVGSQVSGCFATSSCHHVSRPAFIAMSEPVRL